MIVFNNKKSMDYVKEIYTSEINVEKADRLDDQENYVDLTFIIGDNDRTYTKIYTKCDNFNFYPVNFLFLSKNIPSGPSYSVHISPLIKSARCCTHDDFG